MYHDRLRETLAAHLSVDDTRDIHGRLVRTLTVRGIDDPEALFEHYKGAGDRAGAAEQAARAATKAHAVLAFDRAAVFYRSALELMPGAPAAAEWTQGLAEALTNAGRPPEAAHVYLEASTGAAAGGRSICSVAPPNSSSSAATSTAAWTSSARSCAPCTCGWRRAR